MKLNSQIEQRSNVFSVVEANLCFVFIDFFLNHSKLKHFQHARATWGAVGHGALYHSQVHFCNYAYCSYSGQLVYYLDAEFYPFPRGIF